MQGEWPYEAIIGELHHIMGNIPRDPRMPQDRLRECTTLHEILARELDLTPIEVPALKDDLLEHVLREVVDCQPHNPSLQSARELLGLTLLSESEVQEKLRLENPVGLRPIDIRAGYRSKAVRQFLACPDISIRTARYRQKDTWVPAVANGLHHLLDRHREKVRAIAVRLGVIPTGPQYRQRGDLRLTATVANVTAKDTTCYDSVDTKVDQVVKIQMRYENLRQVKALRDFVPQFRLPGERSREHCVVATGTALGGHIAEVPVTIRSTIPTYLVYIPGTAKWRRNIALDSDAPTYETIEIDDSIVGQYPMPLDNIRPGHRNRATLTILARIITSAVLVRIEGRSTVTTEWDQKIEARPNEIIHMRYVIRNRGNRPLKSIIAYNNLPAGNTLVAGSTTMTTPDGLVRRLPDDLIRRNDPTGALRNPDAEDGLVLTNLAVGKTLHVHYDIQLSDDLPIGSFVTLVGVIRPVGMSEFYNTCKVTLV